MSAPTPNPPGHRPYSTRIPAIPPQPINASVGQARVAGNYGYTNIDHGNGDGVLTATNAQGQRVTSDKNGKFPEQLAQEQATAQEQRVEQERRAADAQQKGVLQPKYDANGLLIGGINAITGESMSMKGNQLVGDGKHNPQLLQKLAQGTSSPSAAATTPQAPTNSVSQVIAGTPADAATALRAVGSAGPLGTAPGSSRIIRDAPTIPSADDPQRTAGNKINAPGGGSVTIPAYNDGAPDGGVYVNGKTMAHDANGNLVADLGRASGAPPTVPTGTPGAAPAGQFAAGFKGVPAQTQAMLAQMYPGLAQAGSEQHTKFMGALKATGSDGSDALSIAHTLFAPRVPTTAPTDYAATKQADEQRAAAVQPASTATALAGQVQAQAQRTQTAQAARVPASATASVTPLAQAEVQQSNAPLGDYYNPNTPVGTGATSAVAGPLTTPRAPAPASIPSTTVADNGASGVAGALKFPDAPKIGEIPKPLSSVASAGNAAVSGISGFGDGSAAGSSKPPGIPAPGTLDKSASASPAASTGVDASKPPQVPTATSATDGLAFVQQEEERRKASAAVVNAQVKSTLDAGEEDYRKGRQASAATL